MRLETKLFSAEPPSPELLTPWAREWIERFARIGDDELLIRCILKAPELVAECQSKKDWDRRLKSLEAHD